MQALEFDFEWEAANGIKGAELACTWASLRVRVNNSVLTRVVDPSDHRIRDRIHVPLYPLAEWLATNWWSLLHESEDRGGFASRSFLERHAFGPAREGYRFPNMRVVSFDTTTRVTWKHDTLRWTGLEFLDREGCEWIDKQGFRATCASLVDAVVARLASCDLRDTFLQEEWQAIRGADQHERKFCETAGALGLDPYSIDDVHRSSLLDLEEQFSGSVFEEALRILHAESLEAELFAIKKVLRAGKASSIPLRRLTSVRDEVAQSVNGQLRERPWVGGYFLAREVRSKLGLESTPLASWRALSRALDEPRIADGRLSRSKAFNRATLLDGIVTSSEAGLPAFAFPSVSSQASRFRFCRGLAELLLAPRSDALLTTARSNRQQRGRAFAAEFLAPSAGLRERVHLDVLDEEQVGELAFRFGVSPWVIEHQIENHGIAQIKEGSPREPLSTVPQAAMAVNI